MTPSPDHVAALKRAYQLWHETRGASGQHWLDLMADDVRMGSLAGGAPDMAFTRPHSGKEEAARYLAGLAADWEMVHFTPEEYIADGDRVVVLSTVAFRNRATGRLFETPKADVFRFRDGRIVEFFEYFDTAGAFAAARPDG